MPAGDLDVLLAELSDWTLARRPAPPLTHRYGTGSEHEADLLLPAGEGPHRLAMLVHGGFWGARFTRTTLAALAVDLADRGWATWNVEYRRGGSGGGVPETLIDLRAALDALAGIAEIAGIAGIAGTAPVDPTSVVVIGHSAGGQLGLCLADVPAVAAVVSLAGVCDLNTAARERIGDGAVLEFMGGPPESRPDAYAAADPMRLLPAGRPTLIVHGDADDRVPVQQSRDYARAAQAAGDPCELLEFAGVGHFSLIDPRTNAWGTIAERLEGLLPGRGAGTVRPLLSP